MPRRFRYNSSAGRWIRDPRPTEDDDDDPQEGPSRNPHSSESIDPDQSADAPAPESKANAAQGGSPLRSESGPPLTEADNPGRVTVAETLGTAPETDQREKEGSKGDRKGKSKQNIPPTTQGSDLSEDPQASTEPDPALRAEIERLRQLVKLEGQRQAEYFGTTLGDFSWSRDAGPPTGEEMALAQQLADISRAPSDGRRTSWISNDNPFGDFAERSRYWLQHGRGLPHGQPRPSRDETTTRSTSTKRPRERRSAKIDQDQSVTGSAAGTDKHSSVFSEPIKDGRTVSTKATSVSNVSSASASTAPSTGPRGRSVSRPPADDRPSRRQGVITPRGGGRIAARRDDERSDRGRQGRRKDSRESDRSRGTSGSSASTGEAESSM